MVSDCMSKLQGWLQLGLCQTWLRGRRGERGGDREGKKGYREGGEMKGKANKSFTRSKTTCPVVARMCHKLVHHHLEQNTCKARSRVLPLCLYYLPESNGLGS